MLQGAMEQRQELMSEMHSAEQSLSVLHQERAHAEHALANTTALGESCTTCHAVDDQFSATKMHAATASVDPAQAKK